MLMKEYGGGAGNALSSLSCGSVRLREDVGAVGALEVARMYSSRRWGADGGEWKAADTFIFSSSGLV
jgi:hypothetical protein